ncbi:DUF885 domain-containing protein [Aquisphaera insulae]|uniref:DUF885 domain-containing protein n=1 Tax=Aquisphaera insulae TaxID=2712864 RepID=UPI0013EB9A91|nr:DUF885 domain-containing protein [Aquisphaera insulae]
MNLLLIIALIPASAVAADGPSPFAKFADGYFASRFAAHPTEGTSVGLHEYDTALDDVSKPRVLARIAELKAQLEALRALRAGGLSFDDEIDAETIEGQARGELLDLETLRVWEVNPMVYAGLPGGAIDGLMKRDFAPKAERLRAVIAREKAIPAVFEAAKANLTNPPREFTDLAIRMATGSVGFFEGSVTMWAKDAAGTDAALLGEFTKANAAVIAAVKGFAAWLESDLKPRSTGKYAIGTEHFLAKLKYEEMVELPLPELLARGEAQLDKDHAAFLETARKIDPNSSPADVMKLLSNDHPTAEDLIPSVRRSINDARRYLIEKKIVTIPSEVRPKIEETPPYARSGSFASMDTPGPYEKKATEAFYYVTPVEKDWDAKHAEEHLRLYNPPVVAMINVHEAYPGHYLQFLYAPRYPTKTRKLIACGTNAEGWAHYSEQMMVDEGFGGGDPKIRLAQLQEALLRDCRYVVGIKLHTEGWTVEQGAAFMVEKGFQEPANAFEESRRGAYNPTYLYYTFGKIEIQHLRDEYRAKKGGTLRDFHDAFVAQGGIPLPLVRRILFR